MSISPLPASLPQLSVSTSSLVSRISVVSALNLNRTCPAPRPDRDATRCGYQSQGMRSGCGCGRVCTEQGREVWAMRSGGCGCGRWKRWRKKVTGGGWELWELGIRSDVEVWVFRLLSLWPGCLLFHRLPAANENHTPGPTQCVCSASRCCSARQDATRQ